MQEHNMEKIENIYPFFVEQQVQLWKKGNIKGHKAGFKGSRENGKWILGGNWWDGWQQEGA